MSIKSFEAAILRELQRQPGCSRLRQKDIQEWATTPVDAQDGEVAVHLPDAGVYVAYKFTPRGSQLRTLKLMAAGVRLSPPHNHADADWLLILAGVLVGRIRRTTAESMRDHGWIALDGPTYKLTARGQDHVDVKAFVRALASNQETT